MTGEEYSEAGGEPESGSEIEITREMIKSVFDVEMLVSDTTEDRLHAAGRIFATIFFALPSSVRASAKSVRAGEEVWDCQTVERTY